ncbi:uroporphyrinogen decarboxylase family protein [Candidatus Latescibacterota bacterium]
MTPTERLLAVLSGKPVDRIPVSLYEIDGFGNLYSPDDPSYDNISAFARERLDNTVMYNPVVPGSHGFLYSGGSDEVIEKTVRKEGAVEITTTKIETPLGGLRMETRSNPEAYTVWTTEYLLKNEEDVDRLLSMPYERIPASTKGFEEMKNSSEGRGIMMVDLCDPMGMILYNMKFEEYTYLAATNKSKFRQLLDFYAERLHDFLDSVLEQGGGPLFRIIGPEACTPPYMYPESFREFVADYDTPLIRKIQKAGCFARLHCHGNIARVADIMLEMQPDAIDPLEAPPGGDIELEDAVNKLGGDICLMGNIQESLFELNTPEEVREEVLNVMEIADKNGRFVLLPTATPITVPLPARVEENLFAYAETGLYF